MYAAIHGHEPKQEMKLEPGFYRIDEFGRWHKLNNPDVVETFLEAENLAPAHRGVSRKSFISGFLACLHYRAKDKA